MPDLLFKIFINLDLVKIYMRSAFIVLFMILLVSGCTKTHEKDFTPEDFCEDKKEYEDPDDLRDEYDQCLLFKEEEIRDKENCRDMCREYCEEEGYTFQRSYTDFAGCHCVCSEKIRLKN